MQHLSLGSKSTPSSLKGSKDVKS
ncbi:uncharacterized protein METZ01_LOCUS493564, partial [marine metagenome]